MQTVRSAALDGGALGVMAVDATIATIVVDTRGAHHFWIAALVLLGLSLGLAVTAVRLAGAEETGPSVGDTLEARETQDDRQLEEPFLADLAEDIRINEQALDRVSPVFSGSLTFLMLAIVVELVGKLQ
jgi:hypothetical protein